MTLSAKAQAIEREFQNARAKASYSQYPEFARRYIKHNKDGVVLANSALLEVSIHEAEISTQKSQKWSFLVSLDDTPESIAESPRIKTDSIQPAVQKLESVLSKGPDEHQEFAAIVLAKAAMATDAPDRFQKVAHYLQNIQLPPVKLSSGHNFGLVIAGLTIKGISLEEEGKVSEAIVSYDHVANLVQGNPHEKSEELYVWSEEALYRAGMLKLRQRDQLAAIRSFRAYHGQAQTWPSNFRLPRRASLYHHFSRSLASSFAAHTNGASVSDDSQFYPTALSQELAQIHAYWEDALSSITTFPRADAKNWRIVAMVEQIVEDRKLLGSGNDADKRSLVETIYRASQKTFQSPRILRSLFHSLVDLGQYDEAELALKSYVSLVELASKDETSTEELLTHEQRIYEDVESKYNVTLVLIAGSLLYGKELQNHAEALKYADKALEYIQKYLQQHESVSELLSGAYNCRGIAYGLQASNIHDPEKRPALYASAIESFTKSIQNSPNSFEGHYLLALQLAETREVAKAILSVKQSLSLLPSHIPSWHLLALLLSSQKDYERALSIATVGLRESEWDNPQTDAYSASQIDGEDYLSLRITQVFLHDHVNGAESSLVLQEGLFGLYNKVFAAEPSSVGEGLFEIPAIRKRDASDSDVVLGSTITGRPRAGSVLSARSKNGGGSDISQSANATLDIPKGNYASSIASSVGSTNSKRGRAVVPAASAQTLSSRSALGLPAKVQRPTVKSVLRTARSNKVLISLWLLSASTFRKLGRFEDALRSIEEAERIDASNPDVWFQLGLLHAAQDDQASSSVSISKTLALSPYHPAGLTRLGRSYIDAGSLEMAEGVLETTTKGLGWDNAEAWFYLGRVFEATDRLTRSKECLWYALELESSRPIRGFVEALPRYLA